MRWRPMAIAALLALACAWGAACGGGGGHDVTTIVTRSSFPQGLLPVLAGTGRGDVTLRIEGDLYVVDGQTSVVTAVSHTNGDVFTFASNVGDGNALVSITPGFGDDARLFVGDDHGKIWTINSNTSPATLFVDTGTLQPITGLAFAPSGYGDFGGQLFAAAGTAGIRRITSGDAPQSELFAEPIGERLVDLAFAGTTLLAIDAIDGTRGQIDKVNPSGTPSDRAAPFQDGFSEPVGIAVDSTASEIYVADAGDSLLYTVPVTGGAPTARAAYSFDSSAPSGIAYDGLAAIAFITTDPPAVRGSNLPRINRDNPGFAPTFRFLGPTVGYGDLEFDRLGGFILVANDADSGVPNDTKNNFVFSAARDFSSVSMIRSGIGDAGEELLSLAINPKTQAMYLGTDLGNLFQRASDGTVTQLIDAPVGAPAMLGLELAPQAFCSDPDPCLVATTENGAVIQIDLGSPNLDDVIRSEPGARFSDLVFASDGTLYVLDCDDEDPPIGSRIIEFDSDGNFVDDLTVDGRLDGIEIDEGGNRLLVVGQTAGPDQLLEITLPISPSSDVNPLHQIDVDDGYFPTGIVYDRLGTAAARQGNSSTSLDAFDVEP